jgi:16S rRNA (cytidine1402-2'-O)-methyltransferase
MLYIVATPIGNLGDMSLRAIETLNSVDWILCEDTRHSKPLLDHFQIKKPLRSFHQFNEQKREEEITSALQSGQTIALISDAGTPTLSDPGQQLVKRCRELGLAVTSIPGACAAIQALALSGFPSNRFQFIGFLPRKRGELQSLLAELFHASGTTICYESPQRLVATLQVIHEMAPTRLVGVARELTKQYEEFRQGTASELLAHWQVEPVRGEIVLLIAEDAIWSQFWREVDPRQHVARLEESYGLTRQEAIKLAAHLREVPKSTLYAELHRDE